MKSFSMTMLTMTLLLQLRSHSHLHTVGGRRGKKRDSEGGRQGGREEGRKGGRKREREGGRVCSLCVDVRVWAFSVCVFCVSWSVQVCIVTFLRFLQGRDACTPTPTHTRSSSPKSISSPAAPPLERYACVHQLTRYPPHHAPLNRTRVRALHHRTPPLEAHSCVHTTA